MLRAHRGQAGGQFVERTLWTSVLGNVAATLA